MLLEMLLEMGPFDIYRTTGGKSRVRADVCDQAGEGRDGKEGNASLNPR